MAGIDDTLRTVFETVAEHLRHEIDGKLAAAAADLSATAAADRAAAADQAVAEFKATAETEFSSRLRETVDRIEEEADLRLREAVAAAEADARGAAREQGFEEGRRQGFEDGLRTGREQGVEEGLDTGRAEGLKAALEAGRNQAQETALSADRLVAGIRGLDAARSLSEILDTLAHLVSDPAPRAALFVVRGASLRVWRSAGFVPDLTAPEPLEISVDDAGLLAEALSRVATVSGAQQPRPAAAPFAQLPADHAMVAVPIAMGSEVVALLYADEGLNPDGRPQAGWQAIVEVLGRHAARSLEAITAFRAAQLITSASRGVAAPGSAVRSEAAADEDEAARRYARLLVSEIKLYHEPEVAAGRRDGHLASRLGGEIARARVLYEERVPAHVRCSGDHFQAELVRTLAGGDASLLEAKS